MMRTTFAAAVALFCSAAAATPPPVTVASPCECLDAHGKGRWAVKTDSSLPPADESTIQAVLPSDVFGWPGIDVQLTWQSERTGIENKWFALTGRVVAVKVEADGDLHIALADATGDKPGIVVCEVPAKPQWCDVRTTVFGWTRTRFPLHIRSTRKLTLNEAPIITVIGKGFWDIGHAPKDQSSRRKNLPDYAVWEIHPVMKIQIAERTSAEFSPSKSIASDVQPHHAARERTVEQSVPQRMAPPASRRGRVLAVPIFFPSGGHCLGRIGAAATNLLSVSRLQTASGA
jgi:hypothetical protein